MRVMFFAHDSNLYGAERALLTLLQGLDRARFECHVVVPHEGPFVDEVHRLGHVVHFRPMVRWVPTARKVQKVGLLRYISTCIGGMHSRAASVARLLDHLRIDVVVTNTVTCLEGAVAARMVSLPHVWHIHESIFGNPALRGILPAILYRVAIRALSAEVVFVSNSLAADYNADARKGRVVYPGLPLPKPTDREAARSRARVHFGLSADAKLVGVVGALHPLKDHATFLAAASLIRGRGSDAHFLIVGDGNPAYTRQIGARVQALGLGDCVKLLGWCPPGEIHELMAGLDVLVISSVQESFGLTAIEALAVETPVVSTRCGGPSEIIRDGVDGRLVPVGDAESMATAIEATLADPAAARAQARAGRQRVTQKFTTESYVGSMQEVIESAFRTRRVKQSAAMPS